MSDSLAFNIHELTTLYLQGTGKSAGTAAGRAAHHKLGERFLAIFKHFHETTYIDINEDQQHYLDTFVKTFLNIFTHTDYVLSEDHAEQFIRLNLTISNLVSISCWRSTDAWVDLLLRQPANAVKFFTLCSARNRVKLTPERKERIFDAGAKWANLWYCLYAHLYRSGLVRRVVCENLHDHYTYSHPRLMPALDVQELYFGSTYIPEGGDRVIKAKVNRLIGDASRNLTIRMRPDPKKIAVFSSMWRKGHSVHRTCVDYVRALTPTYHLTLFTLGEKENVDTEGFDEVKHIDFRNGTFDLDVLKDVDYAVAYYPDIGMSPHSIYLANLRIAPVQIMGTGHPVSCYEDAKIDVFISGDEVEDDNAQQFYAEKLIRLPGAGGIHTRPAYKRLGRQLESSRVTIGCPAAAHKVNWRFVEALREILKTGAYLKLFVGGSLNRQMDFLAFKRDMQDALGKDNVAVTPGIAYSEYMGELEQCDFALDSFPFGGSNVVNDCLAIGLPVVCLEGGRWYGRIGPAMLRRAGLEQITWGENAGPSATYRFACRDAEEYVNVATHLVKEPGVLAAARDAFASANLDDTLYQESARKRETEWFAMVVGELITEKLK